MDYKKVTWCSIQPVTSWELVTWCSLQPVTSWELVTWCSLQPVTSWELVTWCSLQPLTSWEPWSRESFFSSFFVKCLTWNYSEVIIEQFFEKKRRNKFSHILWFLGCSGHKFQNHFGPYLCNLQKFNEFYLHHFFQKIFQSITIDKFLKGLSCGHGTILRTSQIPDIVNPFKMMGCSLGKQSYCHALTIHDLVCMTISCETFCRPLPLNHVERPQLEAAFFI